MSIDTPASRSTTPEEYSTPRPNPEKELPIDALLCSLTRAGAILNLPMPDSDIQNDGTVQNTLWCVCGLIEQSTIMIEHSAGIGEVKS